MATEWITAKQLSEMTGLGIAMAQRSLQKRFFKKQPLAVRFEKSKKGKPTALVLWDLSTNQPAAAEGVLHEDDNLSTGDAGVRAMGGGGVDVGLPIVPPMAPTAPSIPVAEKAMAEPLRPPAGKKLPPAPKAQAAALQEVVCMAVSDDNPGSGDDFEALLFRKLIGKTPSTASSLRSYYRKLYQKTGEIPPALVVGDGRRFAGKKSTLDKAIQNRFIDMVAKASDATDIFNYYTQDQRKVTVFHENLEREFGRSIAINQLYSLVRSCNLRRYLELPDDEIAKQKMPGFFKAEPVGSLVQMDGVEADYLEIMADGRWRKPIWIELMDLGSRKLLAMHAYLSESNEHSVDIFMRFLRGNNFAQREMRIRPDQAGGFRNLKRPIKELNNRYAYPGGFAFIDDFARAGTPKDKAHLESSHRNAHKSLERGIINHFSLLGKIDSQYKKQKKTGNNLKTVTVTRLSIGLDELNGCGMTEAYMHRHNSKVHRFSEDGTQRSWAPNDRWTEYLTSYQTFEFKPEDIELCRVYGYTKAAATINKEGTITYQKRKYYVANTDLWSRASSTKVKVSLIDDRLAFFKDSDEGVLLGYADALQAPVKSEKLVDKEKAKVVKIHTDNEFFSMVTELKRVGMLVDEAKLRQMVADGLTFEMASQLLLDNSERYGSRPGTLVPFNLFSSDVKKLLAAVNPVKLVPYAGALK